MYWLGVRHIMQLCAVIIYSLVVHIHIILQLITLTFITKSISEFDITSSCLTSHILAESLLNIL